MTSSTSKVYTNSVALIRGGSNPMPGEISLANNGVLFLDVLSRHIAEAIGYRNLDRSDYGTIY